MSITHWGMAALESVELLQLSKRREFAQWGQLTHGQDSAGRDRGTFVACAWRYHAVVAASGWRRHNPDG